MGYQKSLRESIVDLTDVSMSLAKHVISTEAKDGGNLVFSPLSINVVLALVAAGSNGSTRGQLMRYLKLKSVHQLRSQASLLVTLLFADGARLGGPRLSFANGVWVEQSLKLKPDFKQIVEKDFRSALNRVDFEYKAADVRQEANTWAEKITNGLIQEILPSDAVNSSTQLIFANAVYFKGVWKQKFDPSLTKDHDFFLLNGRSVRVPFMTSKKKQHIRCFDDFKVLSLPYKQGGDKRGFAMHIYLPNAKDGLPALVEKVSSTSGFIKDHLPHGQVKVGDFRIPKFKINFGFEASKALTGLGLVIPFVCREMVDSTVKVNRIYHKAFIELNEEGTEAAAASVGLAKYSAAAVRKEDPIDFVADHPFLFVIREDMTGVVLFVGQVLNPELQ